MSQLTLHGRLRSDIIGGKAQELPTAIQLQDLARTLRQVAETACRVSASDHRVDGPDHVAQPDVLAALRAPDRPADAVELPPVPLLEISELPQILQQPSFGAEPQPLISMAPIGRALSHHLLAPVVLVAALAGVALLMFVSAFDISRLADLGGVYDKAQPMAISWTSGPSGLTGSADNPSSASTADGPKVQPTAEELALLGKCEQMIARGDITGARHELAKAASAGSAHARFALAETFDPNVLAAWGLRERVADVSMANALYSQALADGDGRARRRIEALRAGAQSSAQPLAADETALAQKRTVSSARE